MKGIGIVGLGISGVQLALYLQHAGVDTTLYSPSPHTALPESPAMNYAIRWASTLERERSLDLPADDVHPMGSLRLRGPAGSGIDLQGTLPAAGDGTDFRRYLLRLAEIFLARGGRVRVERCGPGDLPALQSRHELVVVAVGRGGFGDVFGVDPGRSPHRSAPRHWTVSSYRGLGLPAADVEMSLIPGAGEVLHMRYRTVHGVRPVLAVGAVPGGPMDGLAHVPHATAPREFTDTLLALLRAFAPHVHERVEAADFAPTSDRDVVCAALTPAVRHAWAVVGGRPVLAVGDAWTLNDPLAAQGANLGSRTAFVLGAAIVAGGPFDVGFAERVAARMWDQAAAPVALSNALLEPPPPHVLELLVRASNDAALANRLADGFGHPEQMLELLTPADLAA